MLKQDDKSKTDQKSPKALSRISGLTVLRGSGQSEAVEGLSDNDGEMWSWLSRELHDGITQQVWYLQMELNSLAERLEDSNPALAADALRLTEIAKEAYQDLRTTLKMLSARSSCDVRIAAELREQVGKFSQTTGLRVELEGERTCSDLHIPGSLAREITRLVQEALWNCLKHSKCEEAKVSLRVTESGLFVTVSDSGCGFDFSEIDDDRYGISNMRERAKSINGKLYVTSAHDEGTKVTLFVPLEEIGARAKRGDLI